jgi:NADH-quinone oxidoreductase subunit N
MNIEFVPMTLAELWQCAPYLVLMIAGSMALVSGAGQKERGRTISFSISLIGLATSFLLFAQSYEKEALNLFNGSLVVDPFSQFFSMVLIFCTFLGALMSYGYDRREEMPGDFYGLFTLICLGMILMASTYDFITLFVGLEIMSLGTYVLVGMRRGSRLSAEASLKYFLMGGLSSAILLYGIALLYGHTGTLQIQEIGEVMRQSTNFTPPLLFLVGLLLVTIGFLFKVGSVPLQWWVPDVYEGAPTNVTGIMTSAVKVAAFAPLIRLAPEILFIPSTMLSEFSYILIWICAALTMFFGNFLALVQTNMKRMLAYSTIAHTGYLLVGLVAGSHSEYGYSAVALYLLFYAIMNLGAFAILSILSSKNDTSMELEDYAGMAYRYPLLSFGLAIFLFSMAGIPPTAGFLGKYYLFSSAVQAGEVSLAVLGVIASVVSVAYYLRVLVYLYMREPSEALAKKGLPVANLWSGAVMTAIIAAVLTLQFGIYPGALFERLQGMIAQMIA